MKKNTCCFTGHRAILKKDIEQVTINLEKKIAMLINMGITHFICGGAIGFDTIAAQSVIMFKKTHPMARLIIAVPCHGQSEKWNKNQKQIYDEILKQADEIIYLAEKYYEGCMQKRNEFMVDNSAYCVAYFRNYVGGTLRTIKYAKENAVTLYYI